MKERFVKFNSRKVVRAAVDMTFQGKTFKAGEVFDWVKEGFKLYYVQRLHRLKQIKHFHEDSKIQYPFRNARPNLPDHVSVGTGHAKNDPAAIEAEKAALEKLAEEEAAKAALGDTPPGEYAGGAELAAATPSPEESQSNPAESPSDGAEAQSNPQKPKANPDANKPANFSRKGGKKNR